MDQAEADGVKQPEVEVEYIVTIESIDERLPQDAVVILLDVDEAIGREAERRRPVVPQGSVVPELSKFSNDDSRLVRWVGRQVKDSHDRKATRACVNRRP